jgi:hypothetical protein
MVIEVGPAPKRLPSTAIALFAYGGLHQATAMCWTRDLTCAAQWTAKHDVAADLRRAGQPVEYDGFFWPARILTPGQDALIGRSRSRVATEFLKGNDCAVLVMIDHDITWQGASEDYEGDIAHLARLSAEHTAIVGAIISKKQKGEGIASMIDARNGVEFTIGKPGLIDAPNVGSGMTAYPRVILQALYDKLGGEIPPGFCPMFMEAVVDHPLRPMDRLHVSEDWIASDLAKRLGYRSLLATRPVTGHIGDHTYTVIGDAYPANMITTDVAPIEPEAPKATFSLLHATRWRPRHAQAARDMWTSRASGKHSVEYIYAVDSDDAETLAWGLTGGGIVVGESRGNVDAYNRAAYASHGDILVQVHDDVEPPQDWDLLIAAKLQDVSRPLVLHVDDGLPNEVNKNPLLTPVMVCTRAWAQKLGGLWFPDYVSVCCDDDASEKAYAEDCVVDGKDITLRHHWGGPSRDETQLRSYARANWDHGQRLLAERRNAGFPDAPERWGK